MVDSKNKTKLTTKKVATPKATAAKKPVVKKVATPKATAAKKPVVKKVATSKATAAKKPVVKKVATPKAIVAKKPVVKKVATPKATAVKKPVVKKVASIKKVSIISKCSENLNFIKNTFFDIVLLYKNFLHWNVSKLIVFVWSIILGFISVIPLILVFIAYTFFSDISISVLINGMLNGILSDNIFGNFILLLIVAVYFIVFSYSNVLLIRVNNSYIEGKKIDYKKNEYFNIKKIIKYFNLSLLNIAILLIPVLLFSILMGFLFLFSGSLEEINTLVSSGYYNYFSILSLIFLIFCLLFLVYTYYRIIFSYLIMSDDKYYSQSKSALTYVKESFNKTKGIKKFFKLITLIFFVLILTSPIYYIGEVLDNNGNLLNNYNYFINLSDEQKTSLTSDDMYYFEGLKVEFNNIQIDEVNSKIKQNYIYLVLFSILNFVFLYGLFVMIFSSFYKREL